MSQHLEACSFFVSFFDVVLYFILRQEILMLALTEVAHLRLQLAIDLLQYKVVLVVLWHLCSILCQSIVLRLQVVVFILQDLIVRRQTIQPVLFITDLNLKLLVGDSVCLQLFLHIDLFVIIVHFLLVYHRQLRIEGFELDLKTIDALFFVL